VNPFTKRESHNKRSLLAYRFLTSSTWLLLVVLSVYYSLYAPSNGRTIWDQSKAHPTAYSLNPEIVSVYWYASLPTLSKRKQPTPRIAKPKVLTNHPHKNTRTLLLLLQTAYIYFLTTYPNDLVTLAANLGSHFILNNVLLSALILLWVHAHFLLAEAILILNFLNLTSLYFRHHKTPHFVHYPVVTAPLCFTFMALFVNGAVVVGSNSLAARICANVAVWAVLVYGMFFLLAFKDYAIGMELSVLCLGKSH
jgi:hypothetical protein